MCGKLFGGGGGSPPPAPQLPPLPPPQEMMDVIDEISGTKYVTSFDPVTGKKVRLLQSLPRTPEQQQLYDQAGQLMDTAIGEMKRLYDYDPSQLVDFKPFVETLNQLNTERTADMERLTKIPDFAKYVEDFQNIQRSILDEEFTKQSDAMRASLIRRGYGNSTMASEAEAILADKKAKANREVGLESLRFGEELYDRSLNRRAGDYALTEQTRANREASAMQEYQLEQQQAQDLEHQRSQQLAHQAQLYNTGANVMATDQARRQGTLAPQAALNEFQAGNQNQLAYHNAEVGRLTAQHQMDMNAYKSQPPSFGQQMLGLAPVVMGGMMGGPAGAGMGMMASNSLSNRGAPVGQIGQQTSWGSTLYGAPLRQARR